MPQDIRINLRSFVVLSVFMLHVPTTIANPPDPHVLKCRTWILARPYEEAQHVCEDELAKSEQSDTLNTSTLLDLLDALTSIHSKAKNYRKAEASASRALRIATSILNPGDPLNAKYMLVLANVLQHQSRFLESEVLYRKALQLIQVDSSQKPQEMANTLTNLAQILLAQGRYDASVPLLRRALRLRTQVNDSTGDALYLLATVLEQQGLLAEAIPLFERAASVFREKYGPMSVQVGLCTVGIAELLRLRGQLNEAEPVFLYALSILKRNATTPQLDLARAYTKLGLLYQTQGRYLLAQNLLQLGFSLRQENLGDSHWLVAESLHSIGINNLHLGQPQSSIPLLWRAISILDSALNFPLLETQATSLLEKQRDIENSLYSLLLKFPDVTELKRLAITVAILRKGRSEDAGRRSNRATLAASKTQAQAVRLTKWKVARAERERLILQGAGLLSPAAYRTRFDELRHEIDELELAILSDQKQTKTGTFLQPRDVVSKVTSQVGSGNAYLEFVWTSLNQPNQPRSHDTTAVSSDSRYLALVLDSSGKVDSYDLGDAAQLDRQVSALLGRLQNRGLDPLPAARAVYQSLFTPVTSSLPSAGRIYVSAEGSLHLIPFSALHDGKNYLIDRYQFIYLNSGRDLLDDERRVESGPPVVVADPEFAAAPPPPMDSRTSQPSEKPADGAMDRGTAGLYAMLTGVTRLPGTLREAVLLSGLWPDAKLLLGREAEETAVRQVVAPLFLHLATHGVFLEDQPPQPMAISAQSARALVPLPMITGVNEPAGLAEAGDSNLQAVAESDRTSALNRSALLLAGAESAPRSRDRYHDGLLTADEVREMNLWGTKLVVLSACDSGRGAIRVGQGVYGLRRAFFAAGAETLVTSLWRVSDAVTTELMGEYYQRLSKGGNRIGALGAAMAVVRKRHPHPYFWAPFLGIGRDAPLGGRSAESPEIAQEKPTKTEPAQQQPIDSSGARQEPQTTESASLQHPGRPTEPLSDSNSRTPETSPDHRSLRAQVFLVGPPEIKLQAAIRLDDNKYTPESETITCGPPCGLWIPRHYQLRILSGASARSKPFNIQDVAGPQITLHCKVKYRRNDIGTVAGLALGVGLGAFHIGLIAIGFSARDKNLFQNSFFPAGLALTVTGVGLTVTGGTFFGVNKTGFSVEQRQGSPVDQ